MAATALRLALDAKFKELTSNVYFQPPASLKMRYPAIRYELARLQKQAADNRPYLINKGYQVMVIDEDPDSEIAEEISKWPFTTFNRSYQADGLNHFVFIIYDQGGE